ncbi:MAG: TauD/TfdA family dioxygenase [Pseudomonadota bacterium]
MALIQTTELTGASVWDSAGVQADDSWIRHLSADDIAEIDHALSHQQASGKCYPAFGRDDFPLPTLRQQLDHVSDALEHGRGFVLLRGLPVERYSDDEVNSIYYGLGLNLGQPVGQNPQGDLIGQVMNVGDPHDKNTRVYQTNRYLPYHTDPSDVVGLLCIRKAKSGGLSSLVSVHAVYNELLRSHPEYLGLFYKQWYYAHLGEDLPSPTALFALHEGKLNFRYLRQYIELGHELRHQPLSRVEIAALDTLDSIIQRPELRVGMMLEPGDIQLANNHLVLHSRSHFEDHEDLSRRRKLLRLWLKMPNARKQPPEFPGRNGFT